MKQRGKTNKEMQEFRNHTKPEEEISHCARRDRERKRERERTNRLTNRRI
jgi:hypothetical protein